MGITKVNKIDDYVKVRNVIISVSDKTGLDKLVSSLVEINPEIKIFSTGGTFNSIKNIIQEKAEKNLIQISDYTGQPETQGGLVKTLDFKIYLGILTETYNESHQSDIARTNAVTMDMVIVNLYPFETVIKTEGIDLEDARGNIDIGGPCMIRAASKNFLRVAPVVDPVDYEAIIYFLSNNKCTTNLKFRYSLAVKAFEHVAEYDKNIAQYLKNTGNREGVFDCYKINN
ncbi:MAG: hypothetical protein HQK76_16935 [Desulfobacterales bacterium]|nr:hypothetical protein [Desulfobacterales bacterium]